MKQAYLHAQDPHVLDSGRRDLSRLLAYMRAMHWHYWTAHWQVWGDPSYADHLLFQRFYEGMQAEIDTLAEKIVGLFGYSSVDSGPQIEETQWQLGQFDHIDCQHKRSLAIENTFQRELRETYDDFKELDLMTLGLDDYLMATANAHETNIYLLQQRIDPKDDVAFPKKASLRDVWFGAEIVSEPTLRDIWFGKKAKGPLGTIESSKYDSPKGAKSFFKQYKKDHPDTKKTWKDFYEKPKDGEGEEEAAPEDAEKTVQEEGQVPDEVEATLTDLRDAQPTDEAAKAVEDDFNQAAQDYERTHPDADATERVVFYQDLAQSLQEKHAPKEEAKTEVPAEEGEEAVGGVLDSSTPEGIENYIAGKFADSPDEIKELMKDSLSREVGRLKDDGLSDSEIQKMVDLKSAAVAADPSLSGMVEKANTPEKRDVALAATEIKNVDEATKEARGEAIKGFLSSVKDGFLIGSGANLAKAVVSKFGDQIKELGVFGAYKDAVQKAGLWAMNVAVGAMFGKKGQDKVKGKLEDWVSDRKQLKKLKKLNKKKQKLIKQIVNVQLGQMKTMNKTIQKALKKSGFGNLAPAVQEVMAGQAMQIAMQTILGHSPVKNALAAADKSLGQVGGDEAAATPAPKKKPKKKTKPKSTPAPKKKLTKNSPKHEGLIESILKALGLARGPNQYSRLDFEKISRSKGVKPLSEDDWAKAVGDVEEGLSLKSGPPTYADYKSRKQGKNEKPISKEEWEAVVESSSVASGKTSSFRSIWKFSQDEIVEEPSEEPVEEDDGLDMGDLATMFQDKIIELFTDPPEDFMNSVFEALDNMDSEVEEGVAPVDVEEPENPVEEDAVEKVGSLREIWAKTPYPTAEHYFFDNPEKREVREFVRSQQISNLRGEEQKKGAPPTPSEIKRGPGGREFSTLNRYVVRTEEEDSGLPSERKESPRHPKIAEEKGEFVRVKWTFARS